MKKVISFCLYGDKNFYCLGLIENIDIINEKYSDWEIYVYYANIPEKILNILKNKQNTYLFECQHNGYNWEGMFWRFYPIDNKENNIDIFLSRDVDSRISDREMKFVNEWINTDKIFHIIRDHPGHRIEILGGTFGMKVKQFKKISNLKTIDYYKTIFYDKFNKNQDRQPDQVFLCQYVWPLIKDNYIGHIALEELRFSKEDILTNFISGFIGEPINSTINI